SGNARNTSALSPWTTVSGASGYHRSAVMRGLRLVDERLEQQEETEQENDGEKHDDDGEAGARGGTDVCRADEALVQIIDAVIVRPGLDHLRVRCPDCVVPGPVLLAHGTCLSVSSAVASR